MAGFSELIDKIRKGSGGDEKAEKLLASIDRKLDDDAYDVTKALHKVERKIANKTADIDNNKKVAAAKGQVKEAQAGNPFEDDHVTKMYVDSLKDIIGEVHHMTRDEMKNNMVRMKGLMQQIGESTADDLKEKQFLEENYKKSYNFLAKEYEKRSAISTRAYNKLGELSEQYLDLQGMYAGLVNHNPIAMGLFKLGADVVKSYRGKKKAQKEMVNEDLRRQRLAKIFEVDKAKDYKLEQARKKKLEAAQNKGGGKPVPGQSASVTEEDLTDSVRNGVTDAFAGFSFPDDEYSNTGDAAMSSDELNKFMGVTGGGFTRDHDAESEAERQEAMAAMRSKSASKGEMAIATAVEGSVEQLYKQDSQMFERMDVRANEDERETDEYQLETKEWQEKVLERLDNISTSTKASAGFSKVSGKGGSGGGGMLSEAGGTMLGVAGASVGATVLTWLGKKFAKPAALLAGAAAPLVAGAAAIMGKVGLGKAGGKLTEKFTGMTGKVLGKDAAEAITKKGTAKVAEKAAAKGVAANATKMIETAKSGATKVATKSGAVAGKGAAKVAGMTGKFAMKSAAKKLPFGLGLLAGIGFGISRLLEGDAKGAGLEVLSGAASIVPGPGTAASVGIDAGLLARDMGAFDSESDKTLGLEKTRGHENELEAIQKEGLKDGEHQMDAIATQAKREKEKERINATRPDMDTGPAASNRPPVRYNKGFGRGHGYYDIERNRPMGEYANAPTRGNEGRSRSSRHWSERETRVRERNNPNFGGFRPGGLAGGMNIPHADMPGISAGWQNRNGIDMGAMGSYQGYNRPRGGTVQRASRPINPDYTGRTATRQVGGKNISSADGKAKGMRIAKELEAQGYSKAQAAGMVGNMMVETGEFKHHQELNPRGGGRGGIGWLQWTGKRRRNYEAYAKANGMDVGSDEANMAFLKHEMEGGTGDHWTKKGMKIGGKASTKNYSLEEYKKIEDPQAAAKYFMEGYERPGVLHQDKRQGYAQTIASGMEGPTARGQATGKPGQQDVGESIYSYTDADAEYFGGKPERLNGMDTEMVNKLRAASKESGQKLTVNSGYRDQEYQDELYQRALKKYGSEKKARDWVAKKSIHTTGHAVDLSGMKNSPEVVAALENQGLHRPMSHEPWHWENAEKTKGKNRHGLAAKLIAERDNKLENDRIVAKQEKQRNQVADMQAGDGRMSWRQNPDTLEFDEVQPKDSLQATTPGEDTSLVGTPPPRSIIPQRQMQSITANQLEPSGSEQVKQGMKLEKHVQVSNDERQKASKSAEVPQLASLSGSSAPQSALSHQTRETDRSNAPSGMGSARNSDSTIQRLTDRWISHSFA